MVITCYTFQPLGSSSGQALWKSGVAMIIFVVNLEENITLVPSILGFWITAETTLCQTQVDDIYMFYSAK